MHIKHKDQASIYKKLDEKITITCKGIFNGDQA